MGSLEEYLALERTGRKRSLRENQRREVWKVFDRCRSKMESEGISDFVDVVAKAADLASREHPRYRGVVIDEAQDLSLAALRMLQGLVSPPAGEVPPDGIFLVGDGAQRIYPSCFTLRQAGLEVRGRSTILAINYRNTARSIDYVVGRLEELRESMDLADIAVLAPTNRVLRAAESALARASVSSQGIQEAAPFQNGHVNVGTFHRAKGLEFKAVIILGLESFPAKQQTRERDVNFVDQLELDRNTLFVAMTRAREVLDLVSAGEPSPLIK